MFDLSMTDSRDAETSLIGAALRSNRVVDDCSMYLSPSDFQDPQLSAVWAAMMATRAAGAHTKYSQMVAEGCDPQVLGKCQNAVAGALGFKVYGEKIKSAARRRSRIESCLRVITHCQEVPDSEAFDSEVFDLFLSGFQGSDAAEDTFTIKQSAEEAMRTAIQALQNGGSVSGLSLGFPSVDERTTGLHPAELVILAARPGMGKTTFALNVARAVSAQNQVAFFSLEMPHDQLGGKMLSTEVGIGSQDLKRGQVGSKVDVLKRAVSDFEKLQLTIFDSAHANLGYMRSKLHQLEARTGKKTDLIMLDYLQLMTGDSKTESRVQEVSKLSRGLKILAKDFKCPVIALSQLNRSVESRTDKRPLLSDLRESGSIEQDADQVWMLYRDDYYDQSAPPGVSELIIAKQRNGPQCTVSLMFDGRLSKFSEYNPPEEVTRWH